MWMHGRIFVQFSKKVVTSATKHPLMKCQKLLGITFTLGTPRYTKTSIPIIWLKIYSKRYAIKTLTVAKRHRINLKASHAEAKQHRCPNEFTMLRSQFSRFFIRISPSHETRRRYSSFWQEIKIFIDMSNSRAATGKWLMILSPQSPKWSESENFHLISTPKSLDRETKIQSDLIKLIVDSRLVSVVMNCVEDMLGVIE